MNKGIVMEVTAKSIIVMNREGVFERIAAGNRHCQVGEEIMYAPRQSSMRQPAFAAVSVIVAAVMLCMMLFSGLPTVFADKSVVAYVSIDINPSVEIGIDKREKVREVNGLNDQGAELVRGIHFKGKPLEDFADTLIRKAEEQQFFKQGSSDIVIASTIVKDGVSIDGEQLSEQLKQQVLAQVVKSHPEQADAFQVTAFSAPAEIRDAAKENGLSFGKYSVYLNAKSKGIDLKVQDFQQDSIHKVAQNNGGISKLVEPSTLSKDGIKELLKEEKDGSLDKKVEEQNRKKADEKKSTPKPTQKNNATPKPGAASTSPSLTPSQKPGTPSTSTRTPDNGKDNGSKNDKNNRENDKASVSPARQDSVNDKPADSGKKTEDGNKKDQKTENNKEEPKKNDAGTKQKDTGNNGSSSSDNGAGEKKNGKDDKH